MIRTDLCHSLTSPFRYTEMPRSYIARLVFDRRHTSLAILSDNPELKDSDDEIIGGICKWLLFRYQFLKDDKVC
jgi:hypothetical protein